MVLTPPANAPTVGTEDYPDYLAKDGREYATTKFHWYKGRIAICPVCDCRPCDVECSEQLKPAPPPRPRVPAEEGVLIGDGNPQTLVMAAMAEAARRKPLVAAGGGVGEE